MMVVEGEKRRVTRKDFEMLSEDFGDGGFIAQKVLWNIAKKRMSHGTAPSTNLA